MSTWARVIEHQKLGEKLYRLRLKTPDIAAAAKPGQFVMLKVRHGKDPLLARPFSIHGVEGNDIFILYRVVGRGTSILSLTRTGKSLALWGPLGTGFDLNVENPILVTGGIGQAPLAFAARALEEQKKEVQWVHGGQTSEDYSRLESELNLLLTQTVRRVSQENMRKFVAAKMDASRKADSHPIGTSIYMSTEDGSLGHHGFVTDQLSDFLDALPPSIPVALLACGPMPMLKVAAKIAAEHNRPCQVSLEAPMACGIGVCLGCVIPAAGGGYLRACQEGPVIDAARVDWNRL